MSTVYLVTDGDYSDYHLLGVYSTRRLANVARVRYAASNIEEYEFDAMPEAPPGLLPWDVLMDIHGDCHAPYHGAQAKRTSCEEFTERTVSYYDEVHLKFSVWATDARHAIKIANEQRAQLIALGQWEEKVTR
jgi:hypothetical protein